MLSIVGEIEELGIDGEGLYIKIRNINKINFDTRDERLGSEDGNGKTFYYEFAEEGSKGKTTTTRSSTREKLLYTDNKNNFLILQSAFDKKYIVEIKYKLLFDRSKLQPKLQDVICKALNAIFTGESKGIGNGTKIESEVVIDDIIDRCKEAYEEELGLRVEDEKGLKNELVKNYSERLKTFKTDKEEIKIIATEITEEIYIPFFKKLNKKLGIDGSIKSVFIRRRKDEI